ncbi:hypothetical protein LTR65_002168 [Meristemomyces frigidus]
MLPDFRILPLVTHTGLNPSTPFALASEVALAVALAPDALAAPPDVAAALLTDLLVLPCVALLLLPALPAAEDADASAEEREAGVLVRLLSEDDVAVPVDDALAVAAQVAAVGRDLDIILSWSAASQLVLTQQAKSASRLESLQMHFTSSVPQLPKLVIQSPAHEGRPGILAPMTVLASAARNARVVLVGGV